MNIWFPTNGQIFNASADIHLVATARDPEDGYHIAVEFFNGTNSLGPGTFIPSLCPAPWCPSFNLTWSNVPPGDYALTAKATDSKGLATRSYPVHVKVTVNPPPTIVTIHATDDHASEPGVLTVLDPGIFTISRHGPTNDPLHVFYAVRGTAGNGVDYSAISNHLVIPAGQKAARVVINPLDDQLPEGTETVVLRLEPPVCIGIFPPPPGCYVVGDPGEAVVYIADNDHSQNLPPGVKITRPFDGQTFETPAHVGIRAETVDPDGHVDHVEFFANGMKIGEETRYFFTPPPPGEQIIYEMVWTNPPVGRQVLNVRARDDQGASTLSPPVTIWVVRTNEPPQTNFPPVVTIVAGDPTAAEGTNCCHWVGWYPASPTNAFCGTNTASFLVRRHGPTNAAMTVHYRIGGTASNGVDYAALPGWVMIPAGRRGAEIKILPADDTLPEKIETVVLGLRVPPDTTSNTPPYVVGYPGRAAAIIVDNDQPRPGTCTLPDRCFHWTKPGSNGGWFRIECSTNLIHWTPICTNMITDGALHFVDPDGDELPRAFYRATPSAPPSPDN